VFSRYSRVGALFLLWVPVAIAQGQDSPQLARALERAERFDAALGPQPQPTAKWLAGDRLAYSPGLKIMHGTSDVMAPLSTTMRMARALIEANRTFELLIMPGQPHGPQGAAGTTERTCAASWPPTCSVTMHP
jgi:hypothetical protein